MLPSWQVNEPERVDSSVDAGLLVSLHFVLSALRRRWRAWVGLTLVGVVLGVLWVAIVPPRSTGTVTLYLAHDPAVEPTVAMATDLSLLQTRTVAESLTDQLGLDLTPEELQDTVVATSMTPQVLQIDVSAPGSGEAVERATMLADVFLDFRGTQMRAGSDAIVAGNRERVSRLEEQAAVLTAEFERLSEEGEDDQGEAAGVLTERSRLNEEIVRLQQSNEETILQTEAVLHASRVIDPAAVLPRSSLVRWLLTIGTALLGGLGVGIGFVLVTALSSNRLRRRDEVALALGVPVRASALGRSRAHLAAPARAVGAVVSTVDRRRVCLGVAAVGGSVDHERVTAEAALALARSGRRVLATDLSERGQLGATIARIAERDRGRGRPDMLPVVVRPGTSLSSPGRLWVAGSRPSLLPEGHPSRPAYDEAEVVLALADVDVGTDLDVLAAWVDEVVLVVTPGQCSAERLRTVSELVRAAGLGLPFAVMTRADRTDESSGTARDGEHRPPPRHAGVGGDHDAAARTAVP